MIKAGNLFLVVRTVLIRQWSPWKRNGWCSSSVYIIDRCGENKTNSQMLQTLYSWIKTEETMADDKKKRSHCGWDVTKASSGLTLWQGSWKSCFAQEGSVTQPHRHSGHIYSQTSWGRSPKSETNSKSKNTWAWTKAITINTEQAAFIRFWITKVCARKFPAFPRGWL